MRNTTTVAAEGSELRDRIVEAARDIVAEEGLDGLSMRAIGSRVGCSPASIYLHFQDKGELLRNVVAAGFERLAATTEAALAAIGPGASPSERLAARARAYARFGLEHTGYFRTMFEIPGVASLVDCPGGEVNSAELEESMALLREASESGELRLVDADRGTLLGWGLVHGLTSLYLSGHLAGQVSGHEEFMTLIEDAVETVRGAWKAG